MSLANCGSLSLAARELGVSHTTVLRRVNAIEKARETRLFDHTGQGYSLTEAGQALRAEALKMKRAVDDISGQISGVDQRIGGPVVITTTDTPGYTFLPALVTRFCERYPELTVTLRLANQLRDTANREADIGLRTHITPASCLAGWEPARFAAAAAKRHSLDRFPRNATAHRFVVLGRDFSEMP